MFDCVVVRDGALPWHVVDLFLLLVVDYGAFYRNFLYSLHRLVVNVLSFVRNVFHTGFPTDGAASHGLSNLAAFDCPVLEAGEPRSNSSCLREGIDERRLAISARRQRPSKSFSG